MPSPQQIKIIQTLLSKTGNQHNKEVIVGGISGARTTSIRELTNNEAIALTRHLKTLEADNKPAEKMRRKIIALAHQLHWHLPPSPGGEGQGVRLKVDMRRLDEWMQKSSYLKKKLNQYTYAELPKLVSQFQQVYKHYISNY